MRFRIVNGTDGDFHIFDHTNIKYVGDGKGYALTLQSEAEAMDVVDIMVERVGA